MVTSEELDLTFQKVGNDFGFDNVSAEFSPFRDLKVKWQRTLDWASFQVSDYLAEAPIEVIEGIVKTIMSKIRGEEIGYPEETIEWLTSHEFRTTNQQAYLERSRMIALPMDGDDRLQESYERLVEDGLINEIEDLKLYWSKADGSKKMGESSCLMRVAILNPVLKDAPDTTLDYCLLKQLANIAVGFNMNRESRTEEISNIMEACPEAIKAQNWLEANSIEV
ncbi:MAG: hypothetical protein E7Z62_01565 [Thermoplasmata archaeon]|nr:hypothetical protein [Thermoplasmata archaeon]